MLAGAWAIGCILWPHSPRAVTREQAAELAALVKRQAESVGVFVNASLDEVVGTAEACGLTMVQLHGDEGPQFCEAVARRAGVKVIKAGRVRARADVQSMDAFRSVDLHLLDSYVEGMPGGTGEPFDWSLARQRRSPVPLLLSGGLDAENVEQAIAQTKPWGVDVSSGVESAPGIKDHEKITAFLAAVEATATADDETEEAAA